jgi:hypothetical protein
MGRQEEVEFMDEGSKISAHCSEGELKVDLLGTFDVSSAERLIKCLKDHRKHIKKAVIETGQLSRMDPRGKSAFGSRVQELEDLCYYLVFCGRYAHEISPTWTFSF